MGNKDSDSPQDLLLRSKISPHLLAVIADWTRRRSEGEMIVAESPVPQIKVLIELKEANTGELEAAGIDFNHLFGLFYSTEIPITRQVAGLHAEVVKRLEKADDFVADANTAMGKRKIELQTDAVKALLGDGFRIVPRFTISAEQGDEWQNSFDARSNLLTHLFRPTIFPLTTGCTASRACGQSFMSSRTSFF